MPFNKTPLSTAITVMIYTRPGIVEAEGVRLTPVDCGPYHGHYAIFEEDEAAERLASGLWVDHPMKLTELDAAIVEAAEKEAKQDRETSDKVPEPAVSSQTEASSEPLTVDEPKEGEKVDGAKVPTKKGNKKG